MSKGIMRTRNTSFTSAVSSRTKFLDFTHYMIFLYNYKKIGRRQLYTGHQTGRTLPRCSMGPAGNSLPPSPGASTTMPWSRCPEAWLAACEARRESLPCAWTKWSLLYNNKNSLITYNMPYIYCKMYAKCYIYFAILEMVFALNAPMKNCLRQSPQSQVCRR